MWQYLSYYYFRHRTVHLLRQLNEDIRVHFDMRGRITRPFRLCVLDQLRLLLSSGITAKEYYIQALWDPDLPDIRKREYLGTLGSYSWQTVGNIKGHGALMEDKLLFDVILRSAGVTTGTALAIYSRWAPEIQYPVIRDVPALKKWFLESGENTFIKPLRGMNGKGALSIGKRLSSVEPSWEQLPLRQPLSIGKIIEHINSHPEEEFIIQKRLIPASDTARFSADVLQTLRVMTLRRRSGICLVAAVIKIGSGRSAVDNLLEGKNMIAPVNLDNGKLGAAVEIVEGNQVWHTSHPVTGVPIEGTHLENIDDIKKLVTRAAECFPWFKSVGWDVALTAEGPLILEGNYWADVLLIQTAHQKGMLNWPEYRALFNDDQLYRYIGMGFMRPLPDDIF
jgi:hypothetical protein